jgi:hypothetical protein
MVKVLIDGKEYEGNEISVINIENCKIIENKLAYGFVEKSVQEFVSVPKEIQFIGYFGNWLELVVENHSLFYDSYEKNWIFNLVFESDCNNSVDCVLVPVKRSELKAGDWAFFEGKNLPIPDVELINQYCLILDDVNVVSIDYKTNGETLQILQYKSDTHKNWFKVVPRSDLK